MAFKLSILTVDELLFEGDVTSLTVPGVDGYLEVLTDHAPLITSLKSGTITIRESSGNERHLEVSGGLFEVSRNQATVLAAGNRTTREADHHRATEITETE